MTPESLRPWLLFARDAGAIAGGFGLFVWEAVFRAGAERPTLIAAYFALMGLPFVLRADEKRQLP